MKHESKIRYTVKFVALLLLASLFSVRKLGGTVEFLLNEFCFRFFFKLSIDTKLYLDFVF